MSAGDDSPPPDPSCEDGGRLRDPGLRGEIRTRGWTVLSVAPDHGTPEFGYTLGLAETFGHPELLMFGAREIATPALHHLAGRVQQQGRFRDGARGPTDAPEIPPCVFRGIPQFHLAEWLGRGLDYYHGRPFLAQQCVRLDPTTGRPAEPLGRQPFSRSQPILADMPPWPFEEYRGTGAITTVPILEGACPILYVYRDPTEGEWQFLDGAPFSEALVPELRRASLAEVLARDPGVAMVARLAMGWEASRRKPGSRWRVRPARPETE